MKKFLGNFMGEDIFSDDEKIITLVKYMEAEIKELRAALNERN